MVVKSGKAKVTSEAKISPEAQLKIFIEDFRPDEQKLISSVRSAVRKRFPTANELVYDYYTFFVINYSSTDHPMNGIVSISARPDGVRLYLSPGPKLPDPKKLLEGSGKEVRFIRVETARQLAHPDVKALIAAAIDLAKVPLPAKGKGKVIIRTLSAKRKPPRKLSK